MDIEKVNEIRILGVIMGDQTELEIAALNGAKQVWDQRAPHFKSLYVRKRIPKEI